MTKKTIILIYRVTMIVTITSQAIELISNGTVNLTTQCLNLVQLGLLAYALPFTWGRD